MSRDRSAPRLAVATVMAGTGAAWLIALSTTHRNWDLGNWLSYGAAALLLVTGAYWLFAEWSGRWPSRGQGAPSPAAAPAGPVGIHASGTARGTVRGMRTRGLGTAVRLEDSAEFDIDDLDVS